jgi:integrase
MGIYIRADSPFWWMAIERERRKPLRRSTGIPHAGGTPEQDRALKESAQRLYATEKAKHTLGAVTTTKPAIGFLAFADWFETHVAAHHRSYAREKSMLKALRAAFGHLDSIAQLDADLVSEWMTTRKKAVVAATVNRELDVLKAMLHRAVPKYLDRSPLGVVRRLRVPEAEPRVLTLDEERRMLAIASDSERALVILAIDTLLRLTNCIELKWAQVKDKQGVIVPLNAKVSHDAVPITRRLRDALAALDRDGEFVFPEFHDGKGPTAAKNAATRAFDRLCAKADVAHGRVLHGVTFHCLRHTGATRALQKGYSVRTVMKLGGWKDERSVIRYTHATDADVRAAAESIGSRPLAFNRKA